MRINLVSLFLERYYENQRVYVETRAALMHLRDAVQTQNPAIIKHWTEHATRVLDDPTQWRSLDIEVQS